MKILLPSIVAVMMSIGVIFVRLKASERPVSAKKILLPPVFMSTGALMFVVPYFRVTGSEIVEAAVVGMVFSTLLIKTSRFEIRDQDIYLKRSKAFAFILIGLLIIRIAFKSVLSQTIELGQLSGMFWILAFSMIVPWRLAMFAQYRKLEKRLKDTPAIS